MMRRHLGCNVFALLILLLLPLTGGAQTLSTADLADEWQVSYVATPTTAFMGPSIQAYQGTVTFSAAGVASGTIIAAELAPTALTFTVTGSLALSSQGLLTGTLALTGPDTRSLEVAEARILADRHTIVGVVTSTRPDTPLTETGLVTLTRRARQPAARVEELAGDWRYHELTPSSLALDGGDADWTRGTIAFDANGCAVADLVFSDGAVRATPDPAGFGCVHLASDGAVRGTAAGIDAQLTAGAVTSPGDLILGVTRAPAIGFPGLVAMSGLAPAGGPAFSDADLAGAWRVYLQRVEARRSGGTWQLGRSVFANDGGLTTATLHDVAGSVTLLTGGGFSVAPDGTVTGTLTAAAAPTPEEYQIHGTMRAGRDLVVGVVTARLGAITHHGLVLLVRELTVLDFAQPAYTVTRGQTARITVLRRGNRHDSVSVDYSVSRGTAPGDDVSAAGTLSFGPATDSLTFDVMTSAGGPLRGSRTVNLALGNPLGADARLGQATAVLTIEEGAIPAAAAGTVRLVAPASVLEGGAAVLTFVRSGGTDGGVTVQWTPVDGTARTALDYTAAGGTLTFATGETTKQATVQTLADGAVEGDETFHVRLQNPMGLTLGTPSAATITILDAQPGLQFAEAASTVSEAAASATIRVVRTGPATGTVIVRYSTSPATAQPGTDYTPVGGVLTFASNVRAATFTVPILADALVESPEALVLTLSEPSLPAQLGPQRTATLTILDNDTAGVFQLSAAAYSVAESAGSALITVRRNGNAAGATVGYVTSSPGGTTATAGVDYLSAQGTFTFGANETTKTFSVPILNDSRDETNETFVVQLQGAVLGVPNSAVVTIVDDDVAGTVAFRAATFTMAETAGVALVTVARTGGAAGGVTVNYATANGSATAGGDYAAASGILTFHAGETAKTLAIAITDDQVREGNETFTVTLSNPGGGAALGALATTTVTITDNETGPTVQFGAAAYSVVENAGSATITVTRTGSTLAGQTVRVRSVAGGTAPAGNFEAVDRIVPFAAGQASATFPVTVNNNTALDGDRTVLLELSEPAVPLSLGVPRIAVLTIRNDDAVLQFSGPITSVTEGGTATLTVQRIGSTLGTATVRYATADGSAAAPGDYTSKTGMLTLGPGVSSQPLTVVTRADTVAEPTETLSVTLSQPTGAVLNAQNVATVQIVDNDLVGTVQFEAASFSVVEGALATIGVVRTGGAAGPITVNYATQPVGSATGSPVPGPGADYLLRSGTLTFAAGATRQTFTVPSLQDTALEGQESVPLQLSVPAGSAAVLGTPATASLNIVDDEQARFQFTATAATVAEAAGSVTLTVQRLGPSSGNHSVSYTVSGVTATAGADFDPAGGTLLFPPGVVSRPLTVPIVADTLSELAETFRVTLTAPSAGAALGSASEATVTITDDDPIGVVQFAAANYSVVEGGAVTLVVTRTGGTAGPVTVAHATSNASATAGADYDLANGVLTFAAGEVSKTLVVQTLPDTEVEGSHAFDVTLSAPTPGLALGTTFRTRVWIVDAQQMVQFAQQLYPVVEGGTATITAIRTGVPAGTVSASVSVGGPAQPGIDYVDPGPITLVFPPGVATQTITIRTLPDTVVEGGETVRFELVSATGGAGIGSIPVATLFIFDNERPDLTVTSVSGPLQAANGLPMTVTAAVRNESGGPAPASKLGVFLSPGDATPGAGLFLGLVSTPTIPALTTATVTGAVMVPTSVLAGQYLVSVVADAPGTVVEELETNNGRTAASPVTLVNFLPDLVVTGVPSPGNTLSGKLLSTPLHVRNAGPVASGPFRVGVYLSQSQVPGTGLLLATRDVPNLAPSSGVDLPVTLSVPDDVAQGQYFVVGLADLNAAVVESDELNNALASAVPFQVTRNLTKLSSVSAAFSTAAVSPTCSSGLANLTLNLAGTLSLATQTGTTGQGTIVLSGPVPGGTVTFRGPFSATVNLDETVTISFTATVSGAITGTATATGSGVIANGVVAADITSGLLTKTTAPVGSCPFTGTLTAAGQPVLFFSLLHFAQGGGFNGVTTPNPSYPLLITELSLGLAAIFDTAVSPSTVTFTGPAGSGVSGLAAERRQPVTAGSFYETDTVPLGVRNLVGAWTVRYRGVDRSFTVTDPQTNARFVSMLPTVVLNAAQTHVVGISWVFRDYNTGAPVPAPAYADAIQIEFTGFGIDYASPDFPRTVTSHTLPTPLPVANLEFLYISFKDTVTGHFYVTTYTQ